MITDPDSFPNLTEFQALLIDHLIADRKNRPLRRRDLQEFWTCNGGDTWAEARRDAADLIERGILEVIAKPRRECLYRLADGSPRPRGYRLRPPLSALASCALLVLSLLVLVGCAGGARIGEDILPGDLGRDLEVLYYRGPDAPAGGSGARYVVIGQNESRSFKEGAGVVKTGLWTRLLGRLSGDVSTLESERIASEAQVDTLEIQTRGANEALGITTGAELEAARIGLLPDASP